MQYVEDSLAVIGNEHKDTKEMPTICDSAPDCHGE